MKLEPVIKWVAMLVSGAILIILWLFALAAWMDGGWKVGIFISFIPIGMSVAFILTFCTPWEK